MGRKKKVQQNDKFNFEDDYIIGISDNKKDQKKKGTKKTKKSNKKSAPKDDRNNIASGEIDIAFEQEVKKEPKKKQKKETIRIEKKKLEPEKPEGNYKLLKILLIICALLLFVFILRFSPGFNINTIVIENNNKVSTEDIENLAGIEKGVNLFSINRRQIAKKIEENPYIAEAKVSRRLPDTIKIEITERTERYYVEYAEGAFAIIDGQGYILDKDITSRDLVGLVGLESNFEDLVLQRETSGNVRIADEDLKKFNAIAKIVDTAQSNDVLQYIKTIDVSNINDIKLNLPGEGKIAYLGNIDELVAKMDYLKLFISGEAGKSGIIFLNVDYSNGKWPFFRENV